MLEPENVTQCTKTGQGLLGTSNHFPGTVGKTWAVKFFGIEDICKYTCFPCTAYMCLCMYMVYVSLDAGYIGS